MFNKIGWKDLAKKLFIRLIGIFVILVTVTIYYQVLPLAFVFLGGYIGVGADSPISDIIIWTLSSVGLLVPSIYLFIQIVRFLWKKIIIDLLKKDS